MCEEYFRRGQVGLKITLVAIYPDDLTMTKMRQKVTGLLPLRDITGYELCVDHLELESRKYRRRVARF